MLKNKVASALFLIASAAWMGATVAPTETFVGSFAEPADGGNIDTRYSTFDGSTVVIVPRSHSNEAISGSTRWRNALFAVRGMQGLNPTFRLPLVSPGSGKMILSGDLASFRNIKLVWSYEPNAMKWNAFDTYTRTGSGSTTWKVEARNTTPFTQDVVYVSINEHFPVADFYDWIETDVLTHALVRPTASEASPGTFVIGYQSGAPASTACSRPVTDMPLYGFVIRDPAAQPKQLIMLVSGQHPYEGQNKIALQSAVDWILNSTSAEARAYRQQYVTVVYPFVNPTGEVAGLWRGTAFQPTRDTNRNWHTTATDPAADRGIDTVIVHKNAMRKDIAALGLGQPYAVFDYHQNFGDNPATLDYLLRSSACTGDGPVARLSATTDFAPYFSRLAAQATIADIASDPTDQRTLRGAMVAQGVKLPLTFERSVYNSMASEWEFGIATVRALVDPATIVVVPPPVVEPLPAPEPPPPTFAYLIADDFTGGTGMNNRVPDGVAPAGRAWSVQVGLLTLSGGSVNTNISSRAVIDAGAADVEVNTTLFLGPNSTGVILRASDGANYLRFTLSTTGWVLQQTAAGVTKNLLSGRGTYVANTDHVLGAQLAGPTVALSVDGVQVGVVDVSFNETATRYGLLSSGSGVRSWRSFEVRQRL